MEEDKRKYYGQQCQDDGLNIAFRNLHHKLVDEVIGFCIAHHITIDEFNLSADGLEDSINLGSWMPCTDSCLTFDKFTDDYKKVFFECDKEFIKGKSKQDIDMIKFKQEPFLQSL